MTIINAVHANGFSKALKINHIKARRASFIFMLILGFLLPMPILACTSFARAEFGLVGHNYDFFYSHGALFWNPAGLIKEGLKDSAGDVSSVWHSKYASLTVNQFGRELPTSGMNTQGLSVILLWNEEGKFGEVDPTKTPVLSELQWIQYQLDQFSTVKEVIENLEKVRIHKAYAELHYVVCDAQQSCALIEFAESGPLIYADQQFNPPVITNHSLPSSSAFYSQYRALKYADIPAKKHSLNYFAQAAWLVEHQPIRHTNELFDALDKVKVDYGFSDIFAWLFKGKPPSVTAWQVVYQTQEQKIYFKTRDNQKLRWIDLNEISSVNQAKSLDIERGEGNVSSLLHSDWQAENERIIRASYKPLEKEFPVEMQNELMQYPETFKAVDTK